MQLILEFGFDENSIDSNDSFVRHCIKFWKIRFISLDDVAYYWLRNKKCIVDNAFLNIVSHNLALVLQKYGNVGMKHEMC